MWAQERYVSRPVSPNKSHMSQSLLAPNYTHSSPTPPRPYANLEFLKGSHISTKEPCILAKGPCISAKEPCISAKGLCISAKEPNISAKAQVSRTLSSSLVSFAACACVCERARESACERARERESENVCVRYVRVCACVCVCMFIHSCGRTRSHILLDSITYVT